MDWIFLIEHLDGRDMTHNVVQVVLLRPDIQNDRILDKGLGGGMSQGGGARLGGG